MSTSQHTPFAEHRTPEMNRCITDCIECNAACIETISYCLSKGGAHAGARHLTLLASCADMCSTSANTMLRGADVHSYTCAACASICEQCADTCSRLRDPEMTRCADACRRCANSCADISPK